MEIYHEMYSPLMAFTMMNSVLDLPKEYEMVRETDYENVHRSTLDLNI